MKEQLSRILHAAVVEGDRDIVHRFPSYGTWWPKVSCTRPIPEDSIWLFREELDWVAICRFHDLSEEFMLKARDYLIFNAVCRSQVITPKIADELGDKLNWSLLVKNPSVPDKVLWEHRDKINWPKVHGWGKKAPTSIAEVHVWTREHRIATYGALNTHWP